MCVLCLTHMQLLTQVKTSPLNVFSVWKVDCSELESILKVPPHFPKSGYLRLRCTCQVPLLSPGPDYRCPILLCVLQAESFLGEEPHMVLLPHHCSRPWDFAPPLFFDPAPAGVSSHFTLMTPEV